MTVADMIAALQKMPTQAEVRGRFDINDHDTDWELYGVFLEDVGKSAGVVIIQHK